MADGGEKKTARAKPVFRRQKVMEKVLVALSPALVGAVYFFGWRVLAMLLWVTAWGCLTEYLLARRRGDPLTGSCLVTCMLYCLSLPPVLPFWMGAVGIVVALFFGKEVFGGFGRNVFNPAIVGRAFVFVSFPIAMTSEFTPVWRGGLGGFAHWGARTALDGVEAVTAATPMWFRRDFGFAEGFPYSEQMRQLLTGAIGGLYEDLDGTARVLAAGSVGEVSALLLAVGGVYLLWTKTANWRLVVSSFGGALAGCALFRYALGATAVPAPLWTLGSGALVYACFFMVTDPVSAPRDKLAQYMYGAFIGVMVVLLRWQAVFAGGVAFAILLGNTIGPSLEMLVKHIRQRRSDRVAERSVAAEGAAAS